MTDWEITKRCAEAMGVAGHPVADGIDECGLPLIWTAEGWDRNQHAILISREVIYNPIHDDAQAMALVKKFRLHIAIWDKLDGRDAGWWRVEPESGLVTCRNANLNRAICECVAQMQAATQPA